MLHGMNSRSTEFLRTPAAIIRCNASQLVNGQASPAVAQIVAQLVRG